MTPTQPPESSTTGAGEPHSLPEIPECHVERLTEGMLLLTHKRTGRTAVSSDDQERLELQGVILRCLSAYPWLKPSPASDFHAGDLP